MIYVGARDPEFVTLVISDPAFDFSTVTDTELVVTDPSGRTHVSWEWSRTPAAGKIYLTHVFAPDGSDVPQAGTWRVRGFLLTNAAPKRVRPATFPVSDYR